MSHEVETMAWSNEVPWHGLGVKIADTLTPAEILKAAKLNWKVTKEPLVTTDGTPVNEFFALRRSTDKKILDVVGNVYKPVQNADAFEFFNDFVKAGKMKMDTAGSLKGGKMVWALASIGNSFKLPGNDVTKGYLLLASPHEQGKTLRIKFTATRVVCNNTITVALNTEKKSGFHMSHRLEFNQNMQDLAKETLGIANDQLDILADKAARLAKQKVDEKTSARYFANVFQPDTLKDASIDEIYENQSKATETAFAALKHAPGHALESAQGTAWGLLNAVTYTVDHVLGKSNDTRMSKAWFGRNENLKLHALELALELAA